MQSYVLVCVTYFNVDLCCLCFMQWLQIIRLARKLPRGELTALKDETAKDEEALDENDLT